METILPKEYSEKMELLQLGHGDLPVETNPSTSNRLPALRLQLGHGDLPVETPIRSRTWIEPPIRFNWATEIYPWKLIWAGS